MAGKQRPLGIPTIKDRVVQTALLIVLEPIFEADLQPEQFAYRAEHSALDAVQAVHRLLNTGYTEVVDADLSGRLKLTVNETKTKLCRVPDETFDFLGYTFGRCYSQTTGRAYLGTRPAKSRIRKLCDSISDLTRRRKTLLDTEDVVACLNRKLRGWANYFKLGLVSKAYRAVDRHVTGRLRRWLCKKHKQPGRGYTRFPNEYLYQALGLVRLPSLTRSFPWAKA